VKLTMMAIISLVMIFSGIAYSAETKKITGEVVDVSCYVAEGAKGEGHKACAIACVKAGEPAGILEENTGKVYVVVTGDHSNPAKKIKPYVAKMVEVTGTVNERGGISTIDIKEIKEIKSEKEGEAKK